MTLRTRFTQLIDAMTAPDRRYRLLAEHSEVPAESWRKAHDGQQRPTVEMLETLARLWPEHAYWLVSGITDNQNGHSAPDHSSTIDAAYVSRPAALEVMRLQAEIQWLQRAEKRSLRDRWEDWLTDQQERNSVKYPRFVSVHPDLAKRRADQQRRSTQVTEQITALAQRLDLAMRKRDAETQAIYGDSGR